MALTAAWLAAAALSLATSARAELARPAEADLRLLHVEGNVGGATAGHTAVRVGDVVFHYQHDGDVFRLMRQGWESFRLEYAGFQNRPIHAVALRIPAADAGRLRETLTATHLEALHALGRREVARRGRALLDDWSSGAATTLVNGAYAFADSGSLHDDDLRRRLDARLDLLALRSRAEQALASGPASEPGFATRLGQRIAFAHALRVLDESRPLRAEALTFASAELDPTWRSSLEALAGALEGRIAELATGEPRHAEALLVAIARHRAVRASLDGSRLQLLDRGIPAKERMPEAERGSGPDERLAARAFAEGLLADARSRALDGDAPSELEWSRLEELATRAAPRAAAIRVGGPARPGAVRVTWPEPGPGLAEARRKAREEAGAVEAELERRFAYDLIERNCVTELLIAIQSGLGGVERADTLLGGPLRIGRPLGYAPWVFHAAARRLPEARLERTPSHREEALAREARASGWLPTRLRESNVVTSALYAPRDADGSFLLFTSQTRGAGRVLRPLLGVANLTVGLGDSLLGAFAAPFDGGHRLRRGLRGMLFSLPELAFVNVRKGSFDTRRLDPARYPFEPTGRGASAPAEGEPKAS